MQCSMFIQLEHALLHDKIQSMNINIMYLIECPLKVSA